MASQAGTYTRCYRLRGEGDIAAATAVQARLREDGVCSFFNWDPRPPHWRLFYESDLTLPELQDSLGSMIARFKVTIEN